MHETQRPRTVGDALAGFELTSAAAAVGFVIAIIGSLGAWITTPIASAAGTDGDGWISIVLAVLGLVGVLFTRGVQAAIAAAGFGILILALGVYELVHLHHKVVGVTIFGQQFAHVGWGVYAVGIGGIISIFAAIWSATRAQRG